MIYLAIEPFRTQFGPKTGHIITQDESLRSSQTYLINSGLNVCNSKKIFELFPGFKVMKAKNDL